MGKPICSTDETGPTSVNERRSETNPPGPVIAADGPYPSTRGGGRWWWIFDAKCKNRGKYITIKYQFMV